jgi:hypothetical protein
MRLTLLTIVINLAIINSCAAQDWEVSAALGGSAYSGAGIGNPVLGATANASFRPGFVLGAVVGDNRFDYVSGELRYLFFWGSPELNFQGTRATINGYTNLVVYDLLVHMRSRDSKVRPFVAGGVGARIFTATGAQPLTQPLQQFALLRPLTQVKPAVSVGGGLKYLVARHTELRFDFRTYMSPLPNRVFRPTDVSAIRGWIYNFVPQVGIGYMF